jgi:hypothetical protein
MADQSQGSRESLRRRLTAKFSFGGDATRASHEKLVLCHGNLEVRLRGVDETLLTTDLQKQIYGEVRGILTDLGRSLKDEETWDDSGWIDVYKTELLMGQLLGGERLKREIEARLGAMEAEKIPRAERLQIEYKTLNEALASSAEPEADTMRRDFLVRALELMQWFYRTQYLARPIYIQATKAILFWGLLAMVFVVAPYVALAFWKLEANPSGLWARLWEIFPLYTALSIGFLGAFFSRLIMLQRNWNMSLDDILLQKELPYNLLRAGVGTCGALIVYFFLRSGIVSGAIFPVFEQISIQELKPKGDPAASLIVPMLLVPSKDLALLMVWSFLAGFSEALVPTILTRTEEQLSSAATVEKK